MKKEKIIKEYQNEVDNFNKKQPKKVSKIIDFSYFFMDFYLHIFACFSIIQMYEKD